MTFISNQTDPNESEHNVLGLVWISLVRNNFSKIF